MNKFLTWFASTLLLFSIASCGESTTTPIEDSTLAEYVGGEDWDDEWPDIWADENLPDQEESEYLCPICGLSLDSESHAEHTCFDNENRNTYVFEGTHPFVKLDSGVSGSLNKLSDSRGTYLGNWSCNAGAGVTYEVSVEEDTIACLGLTMTKHGKEDINPLVGMKLLVNNDRILRKCVLHKANNGQEWSEFGTSYVGCIALWKGSNIISFHVESKEIMSYDFQSITLISPKKVTLENYSGVEVHECTSKDPVTGKCKDYDCNHYECLDKDETGWNAFSIHGNDKTIHQNKSGTDLWNENEDCIGNVAAVGDIIIFAFNATEDGYGRLSLEHSTCGECILANVFDLYFNGELIDTGAKTSMSAHDWFNYEFDKVAYVKVKSGFNQFKMVHKDSFGFNIRSLEVALEKGSLESAQATLD